MSYRTTFIDPDYRRAPKTSLFCARCQKDIDERSAYRVIILTDDFSSAIHPADTAPASDIAGVFPVGMDCARKIGLEFTIDPTT